MFDKFKPENLDKAAKEMKFTLDQLATIQELMDTIAEQVEKTGNITLMYSALDKYKEEERLLIQLSKESKELSKQIKLARKDLEKKISLYNFLENLQ